MDREFHTAVRDEIQQALMKLLLRESVFTLNKHHFKSMCAQVLYKFQQHLPSGWHQIYVVYDGEFFFLLHISHRRGDVEKGVLCP